MDKRTFLKISLAVPAAALVPDFAQSAPARKPTVEEAAAYIAGHPVYVLLVGAKGETIARLESVGRPLPARNGILVLGPFQGDVIRTGTVDRALLMQGNRMLLWSKIELYPTSHVSLGETVGNMIMELTAN